MDTVRSSCDIGGISSSHDIGMISRQEIGQMQELWSEMRASHSDLAIAQGTEIIVELLLDIRDLLRNVNYLPH